MSLTRWCQTLQEKRSDSFRSPCRHSLSAVHLQGCTDVEVCTAHNADFPTWRRARTEFALECAAVLCADRRGHFLWIFFTLHTLILLHCRVAAEYTRACTCYPRASQGESSNDAVWQEQGSLFSNWRTGVFVWRFSFLEVWLILGTTAPVPDRLR